MRRKTIILITAMALLAGCGTTDEAEVRLVQESEVVREAEPENLDTAVINELEGQVEPESEVEETPEEPEASEGQDPPEPEEESVVTEESVETAEGASVSTPTEDKAVSTTPSLDAKISSSETPAKPSETPEISASKFAATWDDEYSGRAHMVITPIENGGTTAEGTTPTYSFNVCAYWSNSAFSMEYWSMIGVFDPESGQVECSGIEFAEVYDDDGNPSFEGVVPVTGSLYFDDNGILRWTHDQACSFVLSGEPNETNRIAKVKASDGFVNLRTGPGTGNAIIMQIPTGAVLSLMEKGENWSQVYFGMDGGYVANSEIEF